jgi:hypothetical protein
MSQATSRQGRRAPIARTVVVWAELPSRGAGKNVVALPIPSISRPPTHFATSRHGIATFPPPKRHLSATGCRPYRIPRESSPKRRVPRSGLAGSHRRTLPGHSWNRSTTDRTSGVSLRLDQSHRPSCFAARRAMSVFTPLTGFPACGPLPPFHADPVARALGSGANRNRLTEASWGGPRSFGSEPLPRCPRLPADSVCLDDPPGLPSMPTGRPLHTVAREPGLDPTPTAVACTRTPTPRCRRLPVDPV